MTQRSLEGQAPKLGRTYPGALLMLFPLLTLALAIAYLQARRPAPGAPPEAPEAGTSRQVEVWEGQAPQPDGGLLTAKLWRLHSDPARQEFDARSLRRRLSFDEGEPWHLELSFVGVQPGALEVQEVLVRDAGGPRLASLPLTRRGGLVDPVSVLFRAPEALAVGEELTFLLWGLEPGEAPELVGVGAALPLRKRSREVSSRGPSIASLRRRARGAGQIQGGSITVQFDPGDVGEDDEH